MINDTNLIARFAYILQYYCFGGEAPGLLKSLRVVTVTHYEAQSHNDTTYTYNDIETNRHFPKFSTIQ